MANERRAVYFAPGWGSFDVGWLYMKYQFSKAGFDVFYGDYPKRGFFEIEEMSKQVGSQLSALKNHYDHITFLGHSMGGLIGRYIQGENPKETPFDTYVSLATPHNGTYAAYFAPWSTSAKQMRPGSEFLKDLSDANREWDTPSISMSAALESIIIPWDHAHFPFSQQHVQVPLTSHVSILWHPRTFREIWGWLIYGIFSEVGFDPIKTSKISRIPLPNIKLN